MCGGTHAVVMLELPGSKKNQLKLKKRKISCRSTQKCTRNSSSSSSSFNQAEPINAASEKKKISSTKAEIFRPGPLLLNLRKSLNNQKGCRTNQEV